MKYCYIDVETGGLDYNQHALLQIGCIIEINDEVKESKVLNIQPFENDLVDQKALQVNRLTEQDLKGFTSPRIAYHEFKDLLGKYVNPYNKQDKFHFVGYNSEKFDAQFIRSFFQKNNDNFYGSWFFVPTLDVIILAARNLVKVRNQMPNFKLETVAQQLGIEFDRSKLHDALYDIQVTREVFKRLS